MHLIARRLTSQLFSRYGEVLHAPIEPGRSRYGSSLASLRPHARPFLTLVNSAPMQGLTLSVTKMERHAFSSQTFIAADVSRWLIIVCPHAAKGGPDLSLAEAFWATSGEGVTYRADTWHHEHTVLDRSAQFIVLIWRDGSADDEEFVIVPEFFVGVPE